MKRVGLEAELYDDRRRGQESGSSPGSGGEDRQSKLYICPEPEIVGAAGAALYALDKMQA